MTVPRDAVPQGTCAADLYRHPQLDADIEAVKEIYSENAVAVRWVLLLPATPAPGQATCGHPAVPPNRSLPKAPGCAISPSSVPGEPRHGTPRASGHDITMAPSCAVPRHLVVASFGH